MSGEYFSMMSCKIKGISLGYLFSAFMLLHVRYVTADANDLKATVTIYKMVTLLFNIAVFKNTNRYKIKIK